jgi:hypothetical protein
MFDGNLSVAVDPDANRTGLQVSVEAPTAHVQLPLATAHDVQHLGALEGVRVGIHDPAGVAFDPVRIDGGVAAASSTGSERMPGRLTVHLG